MSIADEIEEVINRLINAPPPWERPACKDCLSPESKSFQICEKVYQKGHRVLWCHHGGLSLTEFIKKYGEGENT